MNNLFTWLKSTRSISVILVLWGITIGMFTGHISSENYMTIASIIITAYFARRDESK